MAAAQIFRLPIPPSIVQQLAEEEFQDMIKFVVDLKRKIISAGGGLHSDEEQLLLEDGSNQHDLWGGNYYWQASPSERLEYTSMINIRPADSNTEQEIQSEALRRQIHDLALFFFESAL